MKNTQVRAKMTPIERFNEDWVPEPYSGCWLWTGYSDDRDYGQMRVNNKTKRASRFSYEHFVGKIPEGLVIDHLCRTHCCVNPSHLEPVTQKENVLRGESLFAKQARQTHCKNGHLLSGDNIYDIEKNGGRKCRVCRKIYYHQTGL